MSKLTDDFERINKVSFISANQLVNEWRIAESTAKIIRAQPGYRQGHEMAVSKAKTGGWRLYDRVSGQWMDASLADMDAASKAASVLGAKGGSAKSDAKAEASKANGAKGGRPRKASILELDVIKDGKPRRLALRAGGKAQYELYVCYPDGQSVRARYQPECSGIPDLRYLAEKNGFEVVKGKEEK